MSLTPPVIPVQRYYFLGNCLFENSKTYFVGGFRRYDSPDSSSSGILGKIGFRPFSNNVIYDIEGKWIESNNSYPYFLLDFSTTSFLINEPLEWQLTSVALSLNQQGIPPIQGGIRRVRDLTTRAKIGWSGNNWITTENGEFRNYETINSVGITLINRAFFDVGDF